MQSIINLLSSGRAISLLLRFSILLLLPVISLSQSFVGVSSTPADGLTNAGPTAAVTAPGGMLAGDLVVVYVHYRANGQTLTVKTAAGQTWNTETADNGNNQTFTIFWCRYNGIWSGTPAFGLAAGTNALTAVMYVYRPTNANNRWEISNLGGASSSAGPVVTIAGYAVAAPNTVSMAFWGNFGNNTWGSIAGAGWVKTSLGNQYRNSTNQSHTAAYNISSTAGTLANVSQTESGSTTTRTCMITWFEIFDVCANPFPLTSAGSCSNITGSLFGSTATSGVPSCGNASSPEVWYSFEAQTTNPTISLTGVGPAFNTAGVRIQLLANNCGTYTTYSCQTGNTLVTSGLTVGTTYLIRITTNSSTPATSNYVDWDFDICITDPIVANDDCTNAVVLTSATSCSPTSGAVYPSTNSNPTITTPICAGSVYDDVWYKFVAQTTNPTIALTYSTGFTNPGVELLSDNCGGTFTTLFCGNGTTLNTDYLVPGTTYFIRVYSTVDQTTAATFTICITDPVATAPPNDNCANAINLLISASCSKIPGTITGASLGTPGSAVGCSGTVAYDVWYRFTAVSNSSTIALSNFGTNFLTPSLQLFSGACGGLTSLACGTTSITYATISGTTYYIRVYSPTGPAPNGNGNFNICVSAANAAVRFGNSYVNITRKTTGGIVKNGDILEIRMTINHTSGTFSRLRFVDNVPSNTTMATTAPNDSIRVITNEGLTYKKYQLLAANDPARYVASPPGGQYQIRLNLGFGGTYPGNPADNTSTSFATNTGTMNAGSDKPRGGGGMLFAIAYRVQVTGITGQSIVLNPAQFVYYNGTSDVTLTGTPFTIAISDSLTVCSNSIGVNVASEFGGTFGSGTAPNRSTDLTIPINGYTFISNMNASNAVGDGRYAIVKNMSPRSSTYTTPRREPYCTTGPTLNVNDPSNCNNRMYGHWYVAGDHTGTTNAVGNAPPASSTSGGYMLMVNADYVASEIYRQDITNLCPNTYYEFSAWIRNICPTCGIDSIGQQFQGTPTAPAAGYPGVYPNLSFLLNDVDYYSTGELDTTGWQKRGFVFKTAPGQTAATFSIRNNSQGGGGNDWVIDDIAVATCFPNMSYSPTYNPLVCMWNSLVIRDTVRSYFDNYIEYKWQRKAGAGAWTDISGATGTATPVLTGGIYQYVCSYTIPASQTFAVNNGDMYRLIVASTSTNLASSSCSYTDPTSITLNVITNCGPPLKVDLISVAAKLVNTHGVINWVTAKEDESAFFVVEKSIDGINFSEIGRVNNYNNPNAETNHYTFTDPVTLNGKGYYRIGIIAIQGARKYSRIMQLSIEATLFAFGTVINPFTNELQYELNVPANDVVRVELIDAFGKIVRTTQQQVYEGVNPLSIPNTRNLAAGMYVLRVYNNERNMVYKKVMKENK